MEACITPSSSSNDEAKLKAFPERLYVVPQRIASRSGVSVEEYQEDNKLWKKHVNSYRRINRIIDSGRYCNIMDMNAGLGGFAAALDSPKLWVMNVMPTSAEKNTLGVIYERGLIGIYHDWGAQAGGRGGGRGGGRRGAFCGRGAPRGGGRGGGFPVGGCSGGFGNGIDADIRMSE